MCRSSYPFLLVPLLESSARLRSTKIALAIKVKRRSARGACVGCSRSHASAAIRSNSSAPLRSARAFPSVWARASNAAPAARNETHEECRAELSSSIASIINAMMPRCSYVNAMISCNHKRRASSGVPSASSALAFAASASKLERNKASSRASRVGKCRYSVPRPTPALRATSRSDASAPCSVKTSRATAST